MKYLVGTRPTGQLHLGHYASVIKPALEHDADVLIARLHAPSGDAEQFSATLAKFGVRTKLQSLNTDLFFRLMEIAPSHLLNAMPQYKVKEKTALMYCYPVLMAHDVAGYDRVIVGEDQRPHMEFAKDILPRVGIRPPEALYDGGKIMDLRHPENKMSSSDPSSCLFLDDPDYEKKIRKAVTTEAGVDNLINIWTLLGGQGPAAFTGNAELKDEILDLYRAKFIDKPLAV